MSPWIYLIIAYLLGSIPTAVWIGKAFYNTDIRQHGSKNAGATNTFRVLGKAAGSVVFILDVAKGYFAIFLMSQYAEHENPAFISTYIIGAAVCAVLGHVFPILASFKGGKGVATAFGVLLAMTPVAALICFSIFLLIWLFSNYVSLGSIIAAFAYPIVQFFLDSEQDEIILIFSIVISITVILSHKNNIMRLINGIETKTYAFRSKTMKKR